MYLFDSTQRHGAVHKLFNARGEWGGGRSMIFMGDGRGRENCDFKIT